MGRLWVRVREVAWIAGLGLMLWKGPIRLMPCGSCRQQATVQRSADAEWGCRPLDQCGRAFVIARTALLPHAALLTGVGVAGITALAMLRLTRNPPVGEKVE